MSATQANPEREIIELEQKIGTLMRDLTELRKSAPRAAVENYGFETLDGRTSLLKLFAGRDRLLAIHNMGEACRYCTLWGDGINAFLPHLESAMSVVVVSKDTPEQQRVFANSRGWRMRMASHAGGDYMTEQVSREGMGANVSGAACYEMRDNK